MSDRRTAYIRSDNSRASWPVKAYPDRVRFEPATTVHSTLCTVTDINARDIIRVCRIVTGYNNGKKKKKTMILVEPNKNLFFFASLVRELKPKKNNAKTRSVI